MKNIALAQSKSNPSTRPERFSVRSRAIVDPLLSDGAERVYQYLDDQAWGEERVSISQQAIAKALKKPIRTIQRRIAELQKLRYISVIRGQRKIALYEFIRPKPASVLDPPTVAGQTVLDPPTVAGQTVLDPPTVAGLSLLTQETKKQETDPLPSPERICPPCSVCEGRGVVLRVMRGIGTAATCAACNGSGLWHKPKERGAAGAQHGV